MHERAVKAVTRIESPRAPVLPACDSGWATLPADRSFKVLQPSRTPAQLSLFPPPGQVSQPARNGR